MVLYIGDRIDEQFVSEIAKNITEELRMITDAHTMNDILATVQAIPSRLVIINVITIQEHPEQIVKQLSYIQSNLQNNLIIIARGQDSGDPFIQSLYFSGIKNIILSTWIPTVISQCLKYITGMYEETNLLYINEEEKRKNQQGDSIQNQTTKLNLSEVFQNDPDILIQLSEEEQEQSKQEPAQHQPDCAPEGMPAQPKMTEGTVKLTNEELYMSGADLYAQVKEYEDVSEQSTILYHEAMEEQPQYAAQNSAQQQYPQHQYAQERMPQYQYMPQSMGQQPNNNTMISSQQPVTKPKKSRNRKKSKKSLAITLGLCAILVVSIIVPISFTKMQKSVQKKKAQEYLEGATMRPTIEPSEEVAPTNTPQVEIVTGAMEDGQVKEEPTIIPTPETTDEPLITLTPVKEESSNKEPEKEQPPKASPLKTPEQKTPEPTIKPTVKPTLKPTVKPTPKPTVKPTQRPTAKPTPRPTVAPIKIKSLVLPQSIRMIKGTSTDIEMSYSPSNATETINWSSSNTSIATVKNGIITAKKAGTVVITARTSSGIKKNIQVVIGNE